ncbi:YcxB family protein [Saccharothrix australiensis]|uniref:YcxB-like protein n=1 Tax=Saccharothrix australiensis TaxID=2072 RepID=A0A495W4D1_9PSEU|nr:YcxB family protein [Saccharothrix australiensis]RKT55960.1 YcxB-like protein [Saccharothrix australiensis]
MSVDFSWSPRPGDWRDALRTAVPLYRWAPWFGAVLGALGVVVLFLGMTWAGVFGIALAVIIVALVPVGTAVNFHNHPLAAKPVTGSADAHSLRMSVGDAARSELAWAELPGWSETSRVFVLRTGTAAMFAVPHRAFAGAEDVERFRSLLVAHVGPAA